MIKCYFDLCRVGKIKSGNKNTRVVSPWIFILYQFGAAKQMNLATRVFLSIPPFQALKQRR